MAVDKVEYASLYYGLGERLRTALEWLASASTGVLTPGQRVDIDGDNVFATLFEVDTLPPEVCKLEYHQNYVDIQYLLSGTEGTGCTLPDAELRALSKRDSKGDIQFYTAERDTLTIRPGTFYIVWPQDLRAPRVALEQLESVQCLAAKVKLEQNAVWGGKTVCQPLPDSKTRPIARVRADTDGFPFSLPAQNVTKGAGGSCPPPSLLNLCKEELYLYPDNNMLNTCGDARSTTPKCTPLAVPYVPFQQTNPKHYSQQDVLNNGMLFPSLNLPFRVRPDVARVTGGALAELQALEFVLVELGPYLDTHQSDAEIFKLYKQHAVTEKEAWEKYEATNGPITQMAMANAKT